MSKDSSDLYTGVSSIKPRKLRDIKREEKQDQRARLVPGADVVIELIDKEVAKVMDISELVLSIDTKEENVKAGLLARKMYHEHLLNLKNSLQIILKEPEVEKNA